MQAMRELLASLSEQSLSSDRLLLVTAPVLSEHGSLLRMDPAFVAAAAFAPPAGAEQDFLPAVWKRFRITGDGPFGARDSS